MAESDPCPYTVKELDEEEKHLVKKYYSKYQNEFFRFGEPGCLLPSLFQKHAADIKNMPVRSTDIFIVAFPRSGTTWSQELVWLLANNLNFETAKALPFSRRVPFLEINSFLNISMKKHIIESNNNDPELIQLLGASERLVSELLADIPTPRTIKSHLPISLLPHGTLDTAKLVYVARDPRDVIVSSYYFYKMNVLLELDCEFREYFEIFMKDLTAWGPYFDHIKEALSQRHHRNMLFLFYEELYEDLNGTARRVAHFLDKQYTDVEFSHLCDFLSFESFQRSEAINPKSHKYFLKQNSNFIRRGKAGGWRDYFDEEMTRRAQRWIEANTRDTDLCFPQ